MPAETFTNPFDLLYSALWTAIISHRCLPDYVQVANRPRFDSDSRRPVRERIASADLPELLLLPVSMDGGFRSTSSSSNLIKRYQFVITTGDMRLDKALHPLSWIIYSTLVHKYCEIKATQFLGHPFITKMDFAGSQDGRSEAQRQANINGWSTVQLIEFHMSFPTALVSSSVTGEEL